MQHAMQPYMKLVQSNMDLITQFTTRPEVTAQATASAQNLFQQGQESATKLMQSNAFAHLVQGMLKNYTDFIAEVGQSGMALMTQGQAAMVQQVQSATDNVVEATDVRSRRTREAA
jgi:hypothetical protein